MRLCNCGADQKSRWHDEDCIIFEDTSVRPEVLAVCALCAATILYVIIRILVGIYTI